MVLIIDIWFRIPLNFQKQHTQLIICEFKTSIIEIHKTEQNLELSLRDSIHDIYFSWYPAAMTKTT